MKFEDASFEDFSTRVVSHHLRGALNALHLSLRVLENQPSDEDAREFARYVLDSAQKVDRLVRDIYPASDRPAVFARPQDERERVVSLPTRA